MDFIMIILRRVIIFGKRFKSQALITDIIKESFLILYGCEYACYIISVLAPTFKESGFIASLFACQYKNFFIHDKQSITHQFLE